MKKILALSLLAIGITQADYRVTLPMDGKSIQFKNEVITNPNPTPTPEPEPEPTPPETWTAGTPVLGSWTNVGELFDCSTLPSVDDYSIGVKFTQTKTCSQNQEQTVKTPETSSLTQEVRYVDTLNEQKIDASENISAVGERYTNIIKVGYYTLPYNNYSGYLNPNYTSYPDYNSFVQHSPSSLTPNSIAGLEIRWMWTYMDGSLIIMPANKAAQNKLLNYNMTVNGVTCPLTLKTYEMEIVTGSNCFSFANKIGGEFKIDFSLK